jgi:hypothetical protein
MSYIGSTPTTQSFISGTDYFNGTGSQTAFTLSRNVASVNDVEAVVNNVVQRPNDAYTISGTTITFTSAPSSGTSNIYVRYLSTTTQSITPSQNTVSYATWNSNLQNQTFAFKNRLINGAMMIDQRNAGASVNNTTSGFYTLDRWQVYGPTAARFSIQRNAGNLTGTNLPAGFRNYLGITSLAATTLGSSDDYVLYQPIEGFNTADLTWGTTNASTVTLSFWVRSSLTGTFGGSLQNSGSARSYVFSYTINAANTWEQKSVTIAGDTTGSWGITNDVGIFVFFSLGSGTSKSTTAGSWVNGNFNAPTGATSVVGTNGATFYITGVQLEKGSTATSFDYRPYGTELQLCQRYLPVALIPQNQYMYAGVCFAVDNAQAFIPFSVPTRVAPTGITTVGSPQFARNNGAPNGSVAMGASTTVGSSVIGSGLSGFTAGNATALVTTVSGGAQILFNGCEL